MEMRKIGWIISLGCLFAAVSLIDVNTGTPRTRKKGKVSSKKLPVPVVGKEYSLGALYDLITMNDKRANFLVLDTKDISRSAATVGID